MAGLQAVNPIKARAGGWLPHGSAHVGRWTRRLKKYATGHPAALVPPIADLKAMVESDAVLHAQIAAMFAEARHHMPQDPIGRPEVATFDEFLVPHARGDHVDECGGSDVVARLKVASLPVFPEYAEEFMHLRPGVVLREPSAHGVEPSQSDQC